MTVKCLDWRCNGKQVQQYVTEYVHKHDYYQWSCSLRDLTFGIIEPLPVPNKLYKHILLECVLDLPECEGFDAIWIAVNRLSAKWHIIPCHTTTDTAGLLSCFYQRCYISLDCRQQSFWIEASSLPEPFEARCLVVWGLTGDFHAQSIQSYNNIHNDWIPVWNTLLGCFVINNRINGWGQFPLRGWLQWLGHWKQQSVRCSLSSSDHIPTCCPQENYLRNGIIDAWMPTRFRQHCNRFVTTSKLKWDRTWYRTRKAQIQ